MDPWTPVRSSLHLLISCFFFPLILWKFYKLEAGFGYITPLVTNYLSRAVHYRLCGARSGSPQLIALIVHVAGSPQLIYIYIKPLPVSRVFGARSGSLRTRIKLKDEVGMAGSRTYTNKICSWDNLSHPLLYIPILAFLDNIIMHL